MFTDNRSRAKLKVTWMDYLEHDNSGIGDIYRYFDNEEYGAIFTYDYKGYIYCITMEFLPGTNDAMGNYIPGEYGAIGITWSSPHAGKYASDAIDHLFDNWYDLQKRSNKHQDIFDAAINDDCMVNEIIVDSIDINKDYQMLDCYIYVTGVFDAGACLIKYDNQNGYTLLSRYRDNDITECILAILSDINKGKV